MSTVIKVENISKQYRLGKVGTGTISHDLNRWWHTVRGKEDPYLKIGDTNNRAEKGNSEYVWALKDINFEVKEGEVLGIIGRNGAGKSTLLKILSRTTSPSTGLIKIKGRVASLLEVGTGFHPELSGRENIFLNGAILGMTRSEIKSKFDEIVDFSGVERYIDTPVKRYSSGMYVRLAFAVAAHLEPEILIVDEVLAVGDAEFQKKCLGKMKDVSVNDGRTVLFVSHNLGAVSTLCTTCIFMSQGNIIEQGKTLGIIEKYISFGKENSGEIAGGNIIYKQKGANAFFEAIRIISDNEVSDSVSIAKDIAIEIEYTVTKECKISPSIHLLDNYGSVILATANFPSANLVSDDYSGVTLKKGSYKTVCIIPGNFLNENSYSINAFLVPENTSDTVIAEDVLSFSVTDTGEMRKEYTGGWAGMIRPKLSWQTELLTPKNY